MVPEEGDRWHIRLTIRSWFAWKSQMMEERREFMAAWLDALVEQGLVK